MYIHTYIPTYLASWLNMSSIYIYIYLQTEGCEKEEEEERLSKICLPYMYIVSVFCISSNSTESSVLDTCRSMYVRAK